MTVSPRYIRNQARPRQKKRQGYKSKNGTDQREFLPASASNDYIGQTHIRQIGLFPSYTQTCSCSQRASIAYRELRTDYRYEDDPFSLSTSCVTISNTDSLSSGESGVNA
jgi:outer membrane protease